MEFLKKLFTEDDKKVIGLCGFRKEDDLRVYIPKFEASKDIYKFSYEKNFFLL